MIGNPQSEPDWLSLSERNKQKKKVQFSFLAVFSSMQATRMGQIENPMLTKKKNLKKINNSDPQPTEQLDARYFQSRIHTNYIFVPAGYIYVLDVSLSERHKA